MWVQQDNISSDLRTAAAKIKRSLNTGQQDFDANTDTWPLGQAIPKVESNIQVSGMYNSVFKKNIMLKLLLKRRI